MWRTREKHSKRIAVACRRSTCRLQEYRVHVSRTRRKSNKFQNEKSRLVGHADADDLRCSLAIVAQSVIRPFPRAHGVSGRDDLGCDSRFSARSLRAHVIYCSWTYAQTGTTCHPWAPSAAAVARRCAFVVFPSPRLVMKTKKIPTECIFGLRAYLHASFSAATNTDCCTWVVRDDPTTTSFDGTQSALRRRRRSIDRLFLSSYPTRTLCT